MANMLADSAQLCTKYVVHYSLETEHADPASQNAHKRITLWMPKVMPLSCYSARTDSVGTMPLVTGVSSPVHQVFRRSPCGITTRWTYPHWSSANSGSKNRRAAQSAIIVCLEANSCV